MANAPKFRPQSPGVSGVAIQAAPNAGGPADAIYEGLSKIVGRMDENLDQIAKDQGESAGGLAGLAPDFRPGDDTAIRGRAFNAAGLRTALSRLEIEQSGADADIRARHIDDPAGMAAAYDAKTAEQIAPLEQRGLQDLHPDLALNWTRLKQAGLADAAVKAETTMRDSDKAAALATMTAGFNRLQVLGHSAAPDGDVNAGLTATQTQLRASLLAHGPRGAFDLDGVHYAADPTRGGSLGVADLQKILLDAKETAISSRIEGKFQLVRGWGAMQSYRDRVEADYRAGRIDLSSDAVDRLTNKMDADIGHARAQADAATATLRENARDTVSLLQSGYKPATDPAATSRALRLSGHADLADAVDQARGLFDFRGKFAQLPPAAQQAWIAADRARIDKGGATGGDAARHELALHINGEMDAKLKSDPLGWASENAGQALPALNFTDAKSTAASLQARIGFSDAVAQHYGVAPKYFRPGEALQLATTLDAAAPAQRVQLLGAIAGATSGPRLAAMMRELTGTKNGGAYAQAALLMKEGNGAAAAAVAAGLDNIHSGVVKIDGFGGKARRAAAPFLSSLPAALGGATGAMLDSATAIYAAHATGDDRGKFNEALFARSLQEAAGARYEGEARVSGGFGFVNGNTVLVPPQTNDTDLGNLFGKLEDGDLAHVGAGRGTTAPPIDGKGKPLPASVLRDAYPVTVGPGLYAFSLTDPSRGTPELVGAHAPGGVFVMDVSRLWTRAHSRAAPAVTPDNSFVGGN